jgi:hypothetical protein
VYIDDFHIRILNHGRIRSKGFERELNNHGQ